MEVKSIGPINFLFFRTETTVSELHKLLPVGQELIQEAINLKIWVTGPVHWHYIGFSGDVNKSFQLEVAIPVNEIPGEYDGRFHFKRTDPFKCLSLVHSGSWMDIPLSYEKAAEYISKNNLRPTALNREVYVNADFNNPESNITEIQIGVN